MNKLFLLWILLANAFLTKGQSQANNQAINTHYLLANKTVLAQSPWLHKAQNNFYLEAERNSLAAKHFLFVQTHQNILVYGATCKVNMGLNHSILSIFNGFEPIESVLPLPANFSFDNAKKYVWFKQQGAWILAEQQVAKTNLGEALELLISVADGSILKETFRDLNWRKDTLVRTKVFNPDPLTSAQKEYGEGGLFKHNNGANSPELTAELKEKNITLTLQNDTFYPWSPYATILDLESPSQNLFRSTAANFDFNRNNSVFREMNCLYHIEAFRKYLAQIGLPFTDLAPINLDPTAYSGQDQSRFSYSLDKPALFIGTGGVPEAEDADVIIHEYTHYLNYYIAPNTINGNQRLAVEEANCDFMACMHSKAASNFNWRRIFNWDGFNEFWSGRDGNSNNTYPKDVSTDFYRTSLIWSSMLNDISEDVGRDVLTRLLLQSVYSYANDMSMQDAVNLLVQADSLLYGYGNLSKLRANMETRGFAVTGLPNSLNAQLNLQVLNSAEFASGKGLLNVQATNGDKLNYRMLNIQGVVVKEDLSFVAQIQLGSENLSPGVYFLLLSNEKGLVYNAKLVVNRP
jgi:hypothetical protein